MWVKKFPPRLRLRLERLINEKNETTAKWNAGFLSRHDAKEKIKYCDSQMLKIAAKNQIVESCFRLILTNLRILLNALRSSENQKTINKIIYKIKCLSFLLWPYLKDDDDYIEEQNQLVDIQYLCYLVLERPPPPRCSI